VGGNINFWRTQTTFLGANLSLGVFSIERLFQHDQRITVFYSLDIAYCSADYKSLYLPKTYPKVRQTSSYNAHIVFQRRF